MLGQNPDPINQTGHTIFNAQRNNMWRKTQPYWMIIVAMKQQNQALLALDALIKAIILAYLVGSQSFGLFNIWLNL